LVERSTPTYKERCLRLLEELGRQKENGYKHDTDFRVQELEKIGPFLDDDSKRVGNWDAWKTGTYFFELQ
jgi:hypothetical protein